MSIDTLPLPVSVTTRSRRNRCFKPEADDGYCRAKDLHYFGFKLGLRISRADLITHYAGRKNMKATTSPALRRICHRLRKRIETVGSQLTPSLNLDGLLSA